MASAEEKALEELLRDDDLSELEVRAGAFNILSALGAVRRELRHSDFLAYLLDPSEAHGLGAFVVRRLLHSCIDLVVSHPVSSIDISLADLSALQVKREWANIDVLLVDSLLKLVVVIENKIDADEGEEQLVSYRDRVQKKYSGYRHLFVYLTPDGITPSDDEYVPLGYEAVVDALRSALRAPSIVLRDDVRTLVEHYVAVLEDQIVGKSEITDLCAKIYKRHKLAIDLLFENRPDRVSEASAFIAELIKTQDDFVLDKTMKNTVRFGLKAWEAEGRLNKANEAWWSDAHRTLLFQFTVSEKGVALKLSLGPGEDKFRNAFFDATKGNKELFNGGKKKMTPAQTQIYSRDIASEDDLEGEYEKAVGKGWKQFVDGDLAKLKDGVGQILRDIPA